MRYIFIFYCMLSLLFSSKESYSQTVKKRVFLSNLEFTPETSVSFRKSFQNRLKLYLIEVGHDSHEILSQSDIDALFKSLELLQKEGVDTKEFLTRISAAREAEEMIHGKVTKENGYITLSLNNLKNDSIKNQYSSKSVVELSFHDSELDSMLKEVAIKILNPKHKLRSQNFSDKLKEESQDTKSPFFTNLIWGDFEGVYKWHEAVLICESKGMRLPTPIELKVLAQLKEETLREPCCVYWSSKSKTSEFAYYVDINDGYGNYYLKEIPTRVRCVKSQ
ncbi:MAG: hypothetical protein SFU98_12780 [Leptospiraceae bacterium]|nr:hypothetical protein [Leptospiraceae bacterium]